MQPGRGGPVGNTSRLLCVCTLREEKYRGAHRVPREGVPECQESPKNEVEEVIDKEEYRCKKTKEKALAGASSKQVSGCVYNEVVSMVTAPCPVTRHLYPAECGHAR